MEGVAEPPPAAFEASRVQQEEPPKLNPNPATANKATAEEAARQEIAAVEEVVGERALPVGWAEAEHVGVSNGAGP